MKSGLFVIFEKVFIIHYEKKESLRILISTHSDLNLYSVKIQKLSKIWKNTFRVPKSWFKSRKTKTLKVFDYSTEIYHGITNFHTDKGRISPRYSSFLLFTLHLCPNTAHEVQFKPILVLKSYLGLANWENFSRTHNWWDRPLSKSNKKPYVLIEFSTRKNLMTFSVSKITLYSIRNWAAFSVKGP